MNIVELGKASVQTKAAKSEPVADFIAPLRELS